MARRRGRQSASANGHEPAQRHDARGLQRADHEAGPSAPTTRRNCERTDVRVERSTDEAQLDRGREQTGCDRRESPAARAHGPHQTSGRARRRCRSDRDGEDGRCTRRAAGEAAASRRRTARAHRRRHAADNTSQATASIAAPRSSVRKRPGAGSGEALDAETARRSRRGRRRGTAGRSPCRTPEVVAPAEHEQAEDERAHDRGRAVTSRRVGARSASTSRRRSAC